MTYIYSYFMSCVQGKKKARTIELALKDPTDAEETYASIRKMQYFQCTSTETGAGDVL